MAFCVEGDVLWPRIWCVIGDSYMGELLVHRPRRC